MKDDYLNLSHVLKLPARMDSLEAFAGFIEQTCEALHIRDPLIMKLKLAAEELLVNVVRYAYTKAGGEGAIEMRCGMADPETFCMAILDQGTPFNPLLAPQPDLDDDIDNRPVGGLGVFLVREMADHLDYTRENGTNAVLFCKKINPESGTGMHADAKDK